MPGISGIDLAIQMRAQYPRARSCSFRDKQPPSICWKTPALGVMTSTCS
jgi:hypothetical protein